MTFPPRLHVWTTASHGHTAPSGPRVVIPLERAVLCLDCEAIFEMGGHFVTCPSCGSRVAWTLGRLLERPAA